MSIILTTSYDRSNHIHRKIPNIPQQRLERFLQIELLVVYPRHLNRRPPHSGVGLLRSLVHLADAIDEGVADPMFLQLCFEFLTSERFQVVHLKHVRCCEYAWVFQQFKIVACSH